jgi:hypothetical protein
MEVVNTRSQKNKKNKKFLIIIKPINSILFLLLLCPKYKIIFFLLL